MCCRKGGPEMAKKRPKWSNIKRDWGHRTEVDKRDEETRKDNSTLADLMRAPHLYYKRGAKLHE
jgi:hypothetical protein